MQEKLSRRMQMKKMLLSGISALALLFAPQSSPAQQLFQRPSLTTGCWTMTLASNSNNQLVLSAAYTYHVKFTTNGDRFIGHISDGPGASTVDHFEAAV